MDNDPEGWTDADIAPVPSKVFREGPLLIDAEITKRKNSPKAPKVRSEIGDRAISVGRRALEVAILSACSARESNPSREDWEPSWRSIRDGAKDADKAIRAALRALDPKGKTARMFQKPLSQTRIDNPKFGVNLLGRDRRAKRDALILIAAQKILAGLAIDSERRRRDFIARLPAKSSDFEKHAFVRALYEGWVFLMGTRPGSSPVADQNPFLLFVEAGWHDWRGEGGLWETPDKRTSFVRSLNLAQDAISDVFINSLVAAGPGWL
jgi:hypothetical protein